MSARIVLVDNDSTFADRLRRKLAVEVPEFVLTHVVPTGGEATGGLAKEVADAVDVTLSQSSLATALLVDIALDETGTQLDASGIAVARLLKGRHVGAPVYLVTSKVRSDEELAVLSLATREGLDGVFVKTFIMGKLAHAGFFKELIKRESQSLPVDTVSGELGGDAEFEWLRALAELSISECCAVGEFAVANQRARDRTRTIVSDLRKALDTVTIPFPVLVCGEPGAGKSFFVSQVAQELGVGTTDILRRSLATSRDLEQDIRSLVRDAANRKSRVVFIDEVDTKVGGETAYRFLLDVINGEPVRLGRHDVGLPGAIWFMAGSIATSSATFKAAIADEVKGPDFFRRFHQAGVIIEIEPPITFADRVIQGAVGLKRARPTLRGIANQVLYWFGSTPFGDAGEVKAAARRVADRFLPADTEIDMRGIATEDGFIRFVHGRVTELEALDGRVVRLKP
jgi:ATPase family associated with various cellular activities (AAA)